MAELLQMALFFEEDVAAAPNAAAPSQTQAKHPSIPSQIESLANDVADAAERAQALDIRRSWIVEAPAGSGKTGLLIQRFLRLLAEGDVDRPDQVLAITFTRKADGEMRRRVLEQLAAANADEELGPEANASDLYTRSLALKVLARDQALGWGLLHTPQQLNIRTIDSLCAELAASTPLHTGPGGRYSPTDDPDPLYLLAAERVVARLGGPNAQLSADLELLLLHRDALPWEVQQLLADMLRNRGAWGELIPLDTEALSEDALDQVVRPRLEQTLRRLLEQELEGVSALVDRSLLTRLALLGHALSGCADLPAESPLWVLAQSSTPPQTRAEALPRWVALASVVLTKVGEWRRKVDRGTFGMELSSQQKAELRDLFADFRSAPDQEALAVRLCQLRDLPEPELADDAWRVIKALCRVLREALLELQFVFGERQSCDFAEVALAAGAMLRSDGPGAENVLAFAANLRHLLVDEMQDTSAGQYKLLENLTQSWDGATQTVFLVGDPKQSIYEFRQARVERFRHVMEKGRFGQISLGALRLYVNFRSQAALVESFNGVFEQIFPAPEKLLSMEDAPEVSFVRAAAQRKRTVEPALYWHLSLQPPSTSEPEEKGEAEEGQEEAPADEAQEIRRIIESFQRRWAEDPSRQRAPRIAVLARARNHLAAVLQEFHVDHGAGPLLFRAVEIEALNERPEILDLLALTRALLDPGDRIAWLAVLRSPLCGLSLPDLLALTGDMPDAADVGSLASKLEASAHALSVEGQERLSRVWPILRHAQQTVGRTSFSTHVERTWRSLGGDAPLEFFARANALRYLDLLHRLEAGPEPLTLALLQRRLRSLYAEPSHPDASVELMTIHKAKGLEWDLVLVPGLHRPSGRGARDFLKWLEFDNPSGGSEFLLSPIQSKGDALPALAKWMDAQQREREAAEAKRLLYVACTRSREELHLFASVSRKRNGEVTEPKGNSLLSAAWPAAEAEISRQRTASPRGTLVSFPASPVGGAGLALAAAAESQTAPVAEGGVRRLPPSFDPLSFFSADRGPQMRYPDAAALPHAAAFSRPEGSFAARAFGNTLHRLLVLLAERLADGSSPDTLLAELPQWQSRIAAVLRSEGLGPGDVPREAERALQALRSALQDVDGRWVLGPRALARNETQIRSARDGVSRALRADRVFFAGAAAGEDGEGDYLWVVDYKTVERGGHTRESFLNSQRAHYLPQMEAYARAAIAGGQDPNRLILALYFPLLPALVWWPAVNLTS